MHVRGAVMESQVVGALTVCAEKRCIVVPEGRLAPSIVHEEAATVFGTATVGTTGVMTGAGVTFGTLVGAGDALVESMDVAVPVDEAMAARVFGPTAPYPVVLGEPEETIAWSRCHCWSAACVVGPK